MKAIVPICTLIMLLLSLAAISDQNTKVVDLETKLLVSLYDQTILEEMVARDDRIIDHMLGGTWDRSKNIRVEFGGASWGDVVWVYYQDGAYGGVEPE